MNGCGIIYVATRHDLFLEEAVISADSVKQLSNTFHITLFTDRPQHPLCGLGVFDHVETVESIDVAGSWPSGLLNKVKSLAQSPYDHTLYLDTDTTVLTSELSLLFGLADSFDVGMAEALVDDSFSRKYFARPLFNTGVILYRKNSRTIRWLAEWTARSERNCRITRQVPLPATPELRHVADPRLRRKLLGNDQISLAPLLSPEINRCGLRVVTLDYSWNHRGSTLLERNRCPIRIRHWPRESKEVQAQNLSTAIHRASMQAGSGDGMHDLFVSENDLKPG